MPAQARPAKRLYAVRTSTIHGRGVFAAADIAKGKRIIEYRGERVAWDDAVTRPDSDPDNPFHTFFFSLDDGRVIDANVGGNEARWINHSCAPNCETEESDDGRIYIIAKRNIAKGEELAYNYRLKIDDKLTKKEFAAFECRCSAPKCRGTMLAGKKHRRRAKKVRIKAAKKAARQARKAERGGAKHAHAARTAPH
jgi:SET domain-containing protein